MGYIEGHVDGIVGRKKVGICGRKSDRGLQRTPDFCVNGQIIRLLAAAVIEEDGELERQTKLGFVLVAAKGLALGERMAVSLIMTDSQCGFMWRVLATHARELEVEGASLRRLMRLSSDDEGKVRSKYRAP